MITEATTQVWVRVDLKSRRVLAVTEEPRPNIYGKPVFNVAANFSRLDYYIVETNASAPHGIIVRPATATERAAADARVTANVATTTQRAKDQKAETIREFYCGMLMHRFQGRGFMDISEINCAATYTGTDEHMLNDIKPLGVQMLNAGNEWRFNVCQPVIDAMYADTTGMGVTLDDTYRVALEDSLDAFLTERGFDIAVYHR